MNNRTKNILLGLLIVGVIGMTVAFAALSTTLNISGTANVPAASWDIHFENWTMDKPTNNLAGVANTASQTTAGTMSPSNKGTSISGLVVSLAQPGDTMSYTFDIVNDGSINALLDAFSTTISAKVAPANTENASTSDLTYTVVCGEQATKGSQLLTDAATPVEDTDMLDAGKARACKLTISYNTATNSGTAGDTQTYTGQARTVTLGANWVWVQGNTSAQSGNSGQGENEPATPIIAYSVRIVDTTGYGEAGEYHDKSGWNTSLNPAAKAYIKTDGTTPEVCGVFSNGTVCMTSSYYNSSYSAAGSYASDLEECTNNEPDYDGTGTTCLKGYAKAKADEMLSKGATYCAFSSSQVWCADNERDVTGVIDIYGEVEIMYTVDEVGTDTRSIYGDSIN